MAEESVERAETTVSVSDEGYPAHVVRREDAREDDVEKVGLVVALGGVVEPGGTIETELEDDRAVRVVEPRLRDGGSAAHLAETVAVPRIRGDDDEHGVGLFARCVVIRGKGRAIRHGARELADLAGGAGGSASVRTAVANVAEVMLEVFQIAVPGRGGDARRGQPGDGRSAGGDERAARKSVPSGAVGDGCSEWVSRRGEEGRGTDLWKGRSSSHSKAASTRGMTFSASTVAALSSAARASVARRGALLAAARATTAGDLVTRPRRAAEAETRAVDAADAADRLASVIGIVREVRSGGRGDAPTLVARASLWP